jgi:hypothetical protein
VWHSSHSWSQPTNQIIQLEDQRPHFVSLLFINLSYVKFFAQIAQIFLLDWFWALLGSVLQHWFLITIVGLTGKSIYNRYFHPLSKVPGPFWASISRGWFLWHGYAGKQHKVHVAAHEKHGENFRPDLNKF